MRFFDICINVCIYNMYTHIYIYICTCMHGCIINYSKGSRVGHSQRSNLICGKGRKAYDVTFAQSTACDIPKRGCRSRLRGSLTLVDASDCYAAGFLSAARCHGKRERPASRCFQRFPVIIVMAKA